MFFWPIYAHYIKYSPRWAASTAWKSSDGECNFDFTNTYQHLIFIDIQAGRVPFATAKIVDVAWDAVIGQGGRIVHGWVFYYIILKFVVCLGKCNTV